MENFLHINCAKCNEEFNDIGLFLNHSLECLSLHENQTYKSKWKKFFRWLFSLDLSYFLAVGSGIFINSMIMQRICKEYSLFTCVLEGLCFGFLLTELLRR